MAPVWIIDDDHGIRWVLEKALARGGLPCRTMGSADEAMAALARGEKPQAMLSDVHMPGASGIDLLKFVKERHPELPVIIMTAHATVDTAVAAIQGGAFEYLTKPFDVSHAVDLVRRVLGRSPKAAEPAASQAPLSDIIGQLPSMKGIFGAVTRLSQSHANVLIGGETGTGKDLLARAIHQHSTRKNAPFVAVNTTAIPWDRLESELFGDETCTYTAATGVVRGGIDHANNGTLLLDDIGDLPAALQTRLLRLLSDGLFYRVGGHQPVKAKVRLVAATRHDLDALVHKGLFRADLLHRLKVIHLRLPPLRERREDIAPLARHFLAQSARELGVAAKRLSFGALQSLCRCNLPGNLREIENICHWLTVMVPGQVIEAIDLPAELRNGQKSPNAPEWLHALAAEADGLIASQPGKVYERLTCDFQRMLIDRALAASSGHRSDAAQLLGIGRTTITRKIQELSYRRTGE